MEKKMKICNKCKNKKILSEYYRNKKSKDGHSFYCKVCCSMDGKKYRKSRRDWNKNNKDIVNRSTLEYRNRNPEKKKASNLLGVAIANGKIKRQPCCVCGDMNSHGHHEDYSKPLEVTWLCAIHHKQIHANTNTMKLKEGNLVRHIIRKGRDRWFRILKNGTMKNVIHGNIISPLWYSKKELITIKTN